MAEVWNIYDSEAVADGLAFCPEAKNVQMFRGLENKNWKIKYNEVYGRGMWTDAWE